MITLYLLIFMSLFGVVAAHDYRTTLYEPQCLCTIYSIGDSHAKSCFSNNPIDYFGYTERTKFIINDNWFAYCMVNWIGSITMHRVGRDGLGILDVRTLPIHQGDIIVYVFGEIDVRCHIGKQRDVHQRSLAEIIHTLVTNYIKVVLENKNFIPKAHSVIMGIIPPTDQAFNSAVPFYGTLSDRIQITKLLNMQLAFACREAGILFLDIYDDFADTDGALKVSLSDGIVHVHVAHNHSIKQKLVNMIYNQIIV